MRLWRCRFGIYARNYELIDDKENLRENAELSSAGNLVYNSKAIINNVRIHKDVTPYVIPWVNEEEFEYISDIHGRWYADNNNAASTATNTKLTFMYDGYMPDENAWVVPEYKKGTTPSDPGWVGTLCDNVSTVVFDESFKKYKPTSCYKWFFGFQSLIELEGIKEECNLNTENVISMSNMFYGCYKLNSLDLSTLNTEQVESMALMFFNCEKLENLKMGSTKNVQSFYNMFGYCNNLIGLDLSSFNTESATTMERMFGDCKLLKVVKFGKDFKPATNIGSMFYRCPALETIIVFGETWQSSYFNDVEVFTMCDKLVGGNGTKYKSTNNNNPDFFHIDGNNDIPGYLTKLPYTIKYVEDDKEVNYEGLPTEYNPYDANISFFANNSSTPIELTAPPSKEGYHFVGWSDELNTGLKDVTETVKIDPSVDRFNRIYKANWEINQYTLVYKDRGIVCSSYSAEYQSEIIQSEIFSNYGQYVKNDGYTFEGWTKDDGTIVEFPMLMPLNGLTVNAKWTPITYTIKYNLDGGTLPENAPTSYNIETETFTLVPPTKPDYAFVGWSDGKEIYPEIKISQGSMGNVEYTAMWQARIVAKINGDLTYPTNPEQFCIGEEKSISLTYSFTTGTATNYKITFENNAIPTVEGNLTNETIVINIPSDIVSGTYKGSLVFSNNNNEWADSDPYSITITATIPLRNAAVQLYTDMLIVDNHEGIYNAYQWYRNGEALSGATLLYYTEPKFDYNSLYTVKLSGDGKEMMSCPVEWLSTAKALKPSIKVYPNPAKQGENFTLEILDFDEDQNYDIVIFTANGTMVKKISNVEQKTSVTLPSGVYSGSLINGGEKKGFKLIVK